MIIFFFLKQLHLKISRKVQVSGKINMREGTEKNITEQDINHVYDV